MTKRERAVIDAAMREHDRLLKSGWKRNEFIRGHTAQKLWDACAALAASRRQRKGKQMAVSRRLKDPDGVSVLAHALALAWFKYERNFGEVPHGTPKQLADLIELAGGNKMIFRLGDYAAARKGKR